MQHQINTHVVLQVDIAMLKDVKGSHHIEVPIDDSILDFTLHLVGYIDEAVIQDATGGCTLTTFSSKFMANAISVT